MSVFLVSPLLSQTEKSSSFAQISPPLSSALHGSCSWKRRVKCTATLQSQCTSPCSKESSLQLKEKGVEDVEIPDLEFQRPYIMSFGSYVVQEAVLDEEFWAAAWLRAEIYSEGRSYFRYIDSYRKKFAEQEFTALKRRCFQKQGQTVQCVCLVAAISEGCQTEIGVLPQRTLRDRVIGTLDVSIRQLSRVAIFPRDIVSASLYSIMEPEHRYAYIANVCVTRTARRKGIASSLLEVAIKAAKCWNINDLYVHVDIDNVAAQQLYKKVGFQVVKDSVSEPSLKEEQLLRLCL